MDVKSESHEWGAMDELLFCSTAEAAKMLGVSVKTVQAWVDKGALVAWKTVGGHRRVLLESIAQLKAARGNGSQIKKTAGR